MATDGTTTTITFGDDTTYLTVTQPTAGTVSCEDVVCVCVCARHGHQMCAQRLCDESEPWQDTNGRITLSFEVANGATGCYAIILSVLGARSAPVAFCVESTVAAIEIVTQPQFNPPVSSLLHRLPSARRRRQAAYTTSSSHSQNQTVGLVGQFLTTMPAVRLLDENGLAVEVSDVSLLAAVFVLMSHTYSLLTSTVCFTRERPSMPPLSLTSSTPTLSSLTFELQQ